MKPKEKAKELVKKFDDLLPCEGTTTEETNVSCALIVVDEIDLLLQKSTPKHDIYANLSSLEYWQEVKSELKNM
jgi:hypothetical protein